MPKNHFEASPPKGKKSIPDTPPSPLTTNHPTGEAFSAHFEGMAANDDLAANDPLYDRRKKLVSKSPEPTPEPEETVDPRSSKYTRLALSPDGNLELAIKEWKQDTIEKLLISRNILQKDSTGKVILIGRDKLVEKGFSGWREDGKQGYSSNEITWDLSNAIKEKYGLPENAVVRIGAPDIVDYLVSVSVYAPNQKDGELLPITKYPDSIEQVLSGVDINDCHVKPWDIHTIKYGQRDKNIELADGTTTNMAELSIANALQKLCPTRDPLTGRLMIKDPETKGLIPLNARHFKQYLSYKGGDSAIAFLGNPSVFCQNYCKNLARLDVLRPDDFKKFAGSFEASSVAPSDRKLVGADVSLQTPGGKSLKYYLGRDKIVGTEIPLNRETTVLRYLDRQTCGLVRIEDGHEEILTTFLLLSPEDVEEKRLETKNRRQSEGRATNEQMLAGLTFVSGKEMKNLMRPYQIADFAPQLPDESAKEYATRISKLSDARLISKTTRQFFQQYNIGLHQLPWAEQLAASSILIDPRTDKEALGKFCEQYGLAGLRTFISSTHGKNINQAILALGTRAPELAQTAFQKYSELLAGVDDIEDMLTQLDRERTLDTNEREALKRGIHGQLLGRAKNILEKITTSVSQTKKPSASFQATLVEELKQSKADIELFASTVKTATEAGMDISLEDFAEARTTIVSGQDLVKWVREDPQDVKRMCEIYASNFSHNKAKQERLVQEFRTALESGQTKLYLLHYQGKLLSFIRFDKQPDHTLYAGSFNVDPNVRGMKIGEAMMKTALDTEARENILTGTCAGWKPICAKYIEGGFVGVGSKATEGNELNLELVRDDKRRPFLKGPSLSPEEIVRLSIQNTDANLLVKTIPDNEKTKKEFAFDELKDYFLTRYLKPSKGGPWYLVYERRSRHQSEGQTE